MPAITFDTLKFANQLKSAGVPVTHAEAEAKALSEVFGTNLGELATKEDLHHEIDGLRHEMEELGTGLRHEMKELETGLRHEISDLRRDMDARFEKTESVLHQGMVNMKVELIKWGIGFSIAQAGLVIAILRFLS